MGRNETAKDYPKERCVELVRAAVGIDTLVVDEIKGAMPWWSTVRLATRYGTPDRHVFLAGDAAHVFPPWGGFGANAGIADAHNLVWKLVHVINGWSGEELLDTYETERRPIAQRAASISAAMNDERGLMRLNTISIIPSFLQLIPYMTVGYGYNSSIIIGDDDGSSLPTPKSYDLCGRPGTRIPHKWIDEIDEEKVKEYEEDGEELIEPKSTLDWVDPCTYTLITFGEDKKGNSWDQVFKKALKEENPSHFKRPINHINYTKETQYLLIGLDWKKDFGLDYGNALLVRPDGFIAWRSSSKDPITTEFASSLLSILHYK
ncbi:hypothetical protein DFA_01847 [Cavenderia fasciculata]|uniref:FAD-binding domain-containing protein n=1 Tax=Cavenderia fasciculata TaxID=261658 RepID=F4PV53_CACFS|nr:uncharacterized protein DFA_01847 [Cavenderia fasciculata]EGG21961.1 hypothetical protein DFA_01847 [Cavenderia fasciculata]|eukprot:XP_004359812.1 hypothetical protein DFA_01847 [Cavenderia fasciculata]